MPPRAGKACANISLMEVLRHLVEDPFTILIPLGLLVGTIVAGLIVRRLLFRLVREWAAGTDSHLDVVVTQTLRGPIVLWSIILGLHLATQNSRLPARYLHHLPAILGWRGTRCASMARVSRARNRSPA
jgi:hypothetical protein